MIRRPHPPLTLPPGSALGRISAGAAVRVSVGTVGRIGAGAVGRISAGAAGTVSVGTVGRIGAGAVGRIGVGAVVLFVGVGCGDSTDSTSGEARFDATPEAVHLPAGSAFAGISLDRPTGSAGIGIHGLVAAYDMTTFVTAGTLMDFGPHGLHGGVLTNSRVDGPIGGARLFDAVDDRVDLPESPSFDLDGPLTVAAWLKVDRLGIHQHIAACDDKWALWITPADQFRLGDTHGGGWSTAEGTVQPGEWVAVVAILSGGRGEPLTPETAAIYVDGTLARAEAHLRSAEAQELGRWNPGDLYTDDACHLGFESHQGMESHKTLPFVGSIDELLVFSRAWTESEIRAFSTRLGS